MTKILVDSELLEQAIEMLEEDLPYFDKSKAPAELPVVALIAKFRAALDAPQQEAVATVRDPYDTPGLDWHCQHPPRTGAKLYTHPAPSVPEVFDRSKLKRLVTQVFGEGWQIVPPTDDRKDELAADSKRALELLGSIYYCSHFVAETRNEQELEALMRKHGYFIETESQFDAHCQRVAKADAAIAAQKETKE